jgi:hypothetical protein
MERILSEPLLLEKSIPMTKGELMMDVLEELEHAVKGETSDES